MRALGACRSLYAHPPHHQIPLERNRSLDRPLAGSQLTLQLRLLSCSTSRQINFHIKVVVVHRNEPPDSYVVSAPSESYEIAPETMPKAAWYAVHTGRQPGVYTTWAEAEAQVKGFNGAKHKKFSSEQEARAFAGLPGGSKLQPTIPKNQGRSVSAGSSLHSGSSTKSESTSMGKNKASRASKTSSPPIDAPPSQLSPPLRKLAAEGWVFTPPGKVVVYCDGSGINNGKYGARAGIGVWWGFNGRASQCNLSERVPGKLQTNNRGELLAVIRALETCPLTDIPLEIRTDSEYTIMCMTTYLPLWLKKGLLDRPTIKTTEGKAIKNLDLIKHLFVLLRERRAGVKFKHVRGHAGLEGNEQADKLARKGADQPALPDRTDWLDPSTDSQTIENTQSSSDIEVEIDEDCLMTEEELRALEEDLAE